jgi:hypothetical protein
MQIPLSSRMIDYAFATGLFALVLLNVIWVWPIATFRLF